MKEEFTISVFTENKSGVLARVLSVFTKRHINIESIIVSESSMKNIHRYTIVIILEETRVVKLVAQIEKQIDVLKTFYYDNSEILYQEIALYKVPHKAFNKSRNVEQLIRKHSARIMDIEEEYIVIEKTGLKEETEALLEELRPHGIYEFVRSGRVAVVKPLEQLNKYLNSLKK